MFTQKELKGKKAWRVPRSKLKPRLKEGFFYLTALGSVSLGTYAFSLQTYRYWWLLLALLLFGYPLVKSILLETKTRPFRYRLRRVILPFPLFLATGLLFSLLLDGMVTGDYLNFWSFLVVYLVVSYLIKTNYRKRKAFLVFTDVWTTLVISAGAILAFFGTLVLSLTPIAGLVILVVSCLLVPAVLLYRDKVLFNRPQKKWKRKYLAHASILFGVTLTAAGFVSLLSGGWLLSTLSIEGLILLLGGVIINESPRLIPIKDLM